MRFLHSKSSGLFIVSYNIWTYNFHFAFSLAIRYEFAWLFCNMAATLFQIGLF